MKQCRRAATAIFLQLLFPFFAVAAAPVITSLTPNTGAVGSSIVIAGSNFGTSATNATVTFNGTKGTISTISSSSITVSVPSGATTGNVVVTVSGTASNGVLFTVTTPPSISSLTPNTGAIGSSIVIAGSNFGPTQGNGSVTFNGKTATITSWSASSIVAAVPTGATTGNVVVKAAGGVASNGVTFTVTAAPSITSLVPTSGIVGAAVTINGSNFGPTQGNGKVTFNGTVATINSWSATQITTSVPAGATTGNVIVTAAGGVSSKGVTFTVIPPPSITSISPTSGVTGTSVTINGSNFGSTQGSSTVTFNGTAGTVTSWSNTKVVATVPTAATTGNVVVTVNTQASNGVNFKVLPHIASDSPTTQPIGKNVTINGSGFGGSQGSSTVTFGGVAASAPTWTTTQIIATVPGNAAVGSDPIVVTVGGSASNSVAFTAVAALVVTASPTPKANANGWNNTNVSISYTCSGGVTPVQCPATQTVSTEGANQTITAKATDANGNTTSVSTVLSIDKTPPTVTATVTPAPNSKGVVTAPATINFTCSDSLSGIASCPAPVQLTTAGLNEPFSGTATDKAGNTGTTTLTVSVQTAPLAITATATPQPNSNNWNNTAVTVSYACSGGVAPLHCPASQTVSTEGANQSVTASVTDAAGQSASANTTLNIDKTPPTITASVSPVPNAQGVVTAPATITFTCSDALSGVASCTAPIQVSTLGLNESFSGSATDKAGNSANTSVTISLEASPLTIVAIAAPQANAAGWNNTAVTISYTCSGGVAPLQCPASQTVSTEGTNQSFSATVTDAAGQTASTTTTLSIDRTPPTITATVTPTPNAQGVVIAPATITFTCSDTLSGIASCPSPIQVTTLGLNESFSGTATDKAGNSATATVSLSVEATPLTITATPTPQANAAGWNNTAVTISYTCSGGVAPLQCPASQTVSTEGANQSFSATVTDAAGQTASTSTTLSIDRTPPTITATVTPTPNAQGVVIAPATINFTCSDTLSGIASCPSQIQVTTLGLNESFSGTATDKAGNSAAATVSLSVEATPLTITATATPQANAAGWNNTAVTISYTCSGGVAPLQCPAPRTVSTEGANQSFSATVTDAAGQTASTTTTLNIDLTPPTAIPIITPSPNAAGWNNGPVTISFTCSDSVSGIASCPAPVQLSTEGANQQVCSTVVDKAGNSASSCVTVNIDETPPLISASVSPTPNSNGIIFGPSATVTFTCSDALSGIATCPPSPQTITTQGLQTITGTAFDKAGNSTSASVQFNLQNFPPLQIVAVVSPAPNAAGWNNTPVTVSFQCTGGVPPVTCPGSQSLSNEGANQTVSGTATDGNGNSASASVTVNIDLTPPVITAALSALPDSNGIILGTSASVTFTCSDALSGLATCPDPVNVTTFGPQNISGTAVDIAGNTATASVQFNLQPFLPLTVTTTLQPPPNAAGWNNTAVTVTFVCSGGAQPVTCPDAQTVSTDGANQVVTATATDANGNTAVGTATVNVDQTPPLLSITAPTDGSITTSAGVPVSGLVSDALSGVTSVTCNGTAASFANGSFNCSLTITQGTLGISVIATDVAGNTTTSSITTNLQGPKLTITSPNPLDLFNTKAITVTGTIDDPNATITVNGAQTANNNGIFTAQNVVLREGSNVVTATGTNSGGAAGTASVNVVLDTTPPIVTIDSPSDGAVLTTPQIYVTGMVNDVVPGTVNLAQATVIVNGVNADVTHRSFMADDVLLVPGKNVITAVATDRAGNTSKSSITVTLLDAATQQRILIVSGNAQAGPVATSLPQPFTVEVVNAAGQAMPNVPITFNLVKGDGQLTAFPQQGRQITTQTDGNGQASATLQLGTRVGSGNNQVMVSSPGFVGQVMFCATATVGAPAQIHDIAGESQKGVIGQPLPQPFTVVVFDAGGNPAAGAPVVFNVEQGGGTIEGQTTITKTTDSDGRASAVLTLAQEEGVNNNVVSASVAGITGPPAAFSASGVTPGNVTNTTVSGTVLDNANQPLVNVTASIEGTTLTALTDQNGHFVIQNAPVGSLNLFIDGSTSTENEPYPFLEFPIVTVSGQDNHLPSPIFLPELDLDNSAIVGGDEDVTLSMKGVPGVQFTVFAHSATFPDGSHVGRLSVSQVHSDKVPMPPPNATAPHLFWTVQPPRVKFNPPMQIKIPNTEGIPPGTVTEIFCYNHDLEEFASGGTARVTEDGASIISDPGSGVIVSGWGDAPPPPPPPSCADGCGKCGKCENGACVMDPPLDTSVTEVSRTFGLDSEVVGKINDELLRPLLGLGVAAKVDVAQITGKIATRQCCGPETGVGNNTKGSVSGLLAGITIQGKIWPPGPIPNVDITVTVFGFGSVEAKAQFLGGIFVNLAAKINGEIGYQQNDCSEKPVNRSGCFFAKAAVPVTAGFSAQIGGSASVTWDCIFCTKTTIEGEATLLLGGVSFTINIADISWNQPDCDSGIQGGKFDAEPGKAEISVEIKGNFVQNGVSSGFDITHKFLACTIDFTKSPIFDCHSDI